MRTFAWLSIVVALSLLSATASAAEVQTYSKDAFQQAQAAGKPIVVFVTASWCPNCRKQQPVVDDGALAVGTVMSVTLSADHRVIDGAVAAEWMAAFVRRIENPVSALL